MIKVSSAACVLLVLGCLASLAQQEPDGILIYQQPSTSFTEAIEYRTFRQDNALYSSLVTSSGTRKQLKSGGVIALVPYPPTAFEPLFEETAANALSKIDALVAAHPQVRPQLKIASGKWSRALDAFRQSQHAFASSSSSPRAGHHKERTLPPEARLTGATFDAATITHASGVTTIPLAALTSAQILSLNATSRTFQLPLGTERVLLTASAVPAPPVSPTTKRIERVGRNAIAFSSRTLGLADTTFSVWMFFVVLPALILALVNYRRLSR